MSPKPESSGSSALSEAAARLMERSCSAGPGLILWDLVGSCNLKCPSCPVGSMPGVNPKGMISDELFDRVLSKLKSEFPKWQLHFYNWTEPLIHPSIVGYCKAASSAGFHLHLSSNLNHLSDPESLMASGIKTFRISLSGFTQPVYQRGHTGGRIEKVKQNMIRLSAAKKANAGCRTRIHVYYHKYRHNLDEMSRMEAFARQLGFEFIADWAFLMPLEKLIDYAEDRLPDEQRQFVDESIVPAINDSLKLMQPHRHEPCELIDQLVLNFRGDVSLCCAVFDAKRHFIGNYLDIDWSQLQMIKYTHRMCNTCMNHGAHVLYTHFSKRALADAVKSLAQRQIEHPPKVDRARTSIPLRVLGQFPLAESA